MEIKELSIGIWVRCKGATSRVREIESDWITLETARGLDCVTSTLIDPIELTTDLLKKLSFKVEHVRGASSYEGYTTWVAYDSGFCFAITHGLSNTPGRDWTMHIDNADRQTIANCDMAYLHQAQQLARLVGYQGDLFDRL